MSPIEVFRNEEISQATLERLKGKKVTGTLYYRREAEPSLTEFQHQLWNFITDDGQLPGVHQDPRTGRIWQERRQELIEKHGERALVALFPGRGHKLISQFLRNLMYRGGIYTIDDLIENQENLEKIEGFYTQGKQWQAAQMIIDFFEEEVG